MLVTVTVTVVDTTPPVVTASLVPMNVERDAGTFKVEFSCDDDCDGLSSYYRVV